MHILQFRNQICQFCPFVILVSNTSSPWTQRSACLSLLMAGIKCVHHHFPAISHLVLVQISLFSFNICVPLASVSAFLPWTCLWQGNTLQEFHIHTLLQVTIKIICLSCVLPHFRLPTHFPWKIHCNLCLRFSNYSLSFLAILVLLAFS